MGRWKTVIGPKLKARTFENQKTEAKVGVRILNQMTGLGRLALPASSKFYLTEPLTIPCGAVKLIRTHIRLLAQPKSMRAIIDATQREQRHGSA